MKKIMKRLSIALMMLAFVMSFTACSTEEVTESSVDEMIASQMESYFTYAIETISNVSDADLEMFLDTDDSFTVAAAQAWIDNEEELGAFQSVLTTEAEEKEDGYIMKGDVAFENKNAIVTVNYDETVMPTYMTIEVQYSLGELMGQAGMNTLMGIGIVFAVLLFLSILIWAFKFIGMIDNKEDKKASAAAPKAAPKAAPVAEKNLVDDGELVAVIAAAIAASENTSTDSFVVRSIRRKSGNKWSRA